MSNVINLRDFYPAPIPTVVMIDMQQEYVSRHRALGFSDASVALANCQRLLSHARIRGLPIAFMRRITSSPYFNQSTRYSNWIEGFQPINTDMIFERTRPSCYSSSDFAEVIDTSGGHFVMAGFAGETACLSTAIEGFHRSHSPMFLADASASHRLDDRSEQDAHQTVTRIIQLYSSVMTTHEWISVVDASLQNVVFV